MRKALARTLAVVVGLAAVLAPGAASANEPLFGVRFGYYAESENPFAGAELLFPVVRSVYFNPNVEYVFVDEQTYMTFNADFHYDFPRHHRAFVWLGAGLGLAYVNPDGPTPSDSEVVANFLAGVGLGSGSVIPYFQFKLIAKDSTEAVFAFGLRF